MFQIFKKIQKDQNKRCFSCVNFYIFFCNCLFLRLITNHDNVVLQFTTAQIITNYDNRLLQFTIGTLLQFTTTVITIHDRYYNSRQVLLQFTTGITILDTTIVAVRILQKISLSAPFFHRTLRCLIITFISHY